MSNLSSLFAGKDKDCPSKAPVRCYTLAWHQDNQHNDPEHSDTQHNDTQQKTLVIMLSVSFFIVMLNVIMPSVIKLNVVAPLVSLLALPTNIRLG
jgi:hypothetical protein